MLPEMSLPVEIPAPLPMQALMYTFRHIRVPSMQVTWTPALPVRTPLPSHTHRLSEHPLGLMAHLRLQTPLLPPGTVSQAATLLVRRMRKNPNPSIHGCIDIYAQ